MQNCRPSRRTVSWGPSRAESHLPSKPNIQHHERSKKQDEQRRDGQPPWAHRGPSPSQLRQLLSYLSQGPFRQGPQCRRRPYGVNSSRSWANDRPRVPHWAPARIPLLPWFCTRGNWGTMPTSPPSHHSPHPPSPGEGQGRFMKPSLTSYHPASSTKHTATCSEKREIGKDRKEINGCPWLGGRGRDWWQMDTNDRIEEWKLIPTMAPQLHKFTKNHGVLRLKWVIFMVCNLYLNKVISEN